MRYGLHLLSSALRAYSKLTKAGIVFFVLLTASLGYFLSLQSLSDYSQPVFFLFLAGLYLVSSGSFILNQAQEWKIDSKMKRTRGRPIPKGQISPFQSYVLAFGFIFTGLFFLFILQPVTAGLAFLTVALYNIFYTLFWKKTLSHGAVLGALPGALPPVIGASLAEPYLLTPECVYLFFIMFLWQMPHFWILAIRHKEDYKKGGIPVLPLSYGFDKTVYEMGLYVIAYCGLVLISPLFLRAGVMYLILTCPLALKIFYEFYKYTKNNTQWLRFFLWINVSLIACLSAPVMDKWLFLWSI